MNLYGEEAIVGEYSMFLRNYNVWISNKYYAYGHRANCQREYQFRPSIKTMLMLNKLVEQKRKEDFEANFPKYEA